MSGGEVPSGRGSSSSSEHTVRVKVVADAAPEATKQRQATAEEKLYALGYAWDGTEWIKVRVDPAPDQQRMAAPLDANKRQPRTKR